MINGGMKSIVAGIMNRTTKMSITTINLKIFICAKMPLTYFRGDVFYAFTSKN